VKFLSFKDYSNQPRSYGHGCDFYGVLELTRQQKVQIISSGIEAPLAIQGATHVTIDQK
jgi:segregation and condensation protein A